MEHSKLNNKQWIVKIKGHSVDHVYITNTKNEVLECILDDIKSLTQDYYKAIEDFDDCAISDALKEIAILKAAFDEVLETSFD